MVDILGQTSRRGYDFILHESTFNYFHFLGMLFEEFHVRFYLLYAGGFKQSAAGGKKEREMHLRPFRNNNNQLTRDRQCLRLNIYVWKYKNGFYNEPYNRS
jgi:hypothetical protein